MSWKLCITAFVSLLLTTIPQNGFTCGDTEDPSDYFTSFFSRDLDGQESYRPFYYTALLTFYDGGMWDEPATNEDDNIIQEWKAYTKQTMPAGDAAHFIYRVTANDVQQIINAVTGNRPPQLPDSIRTNGMTKYFLSQKDAAAAGYLLFAKKAERFTTTEAWEGPQKRDSALLNTYIDEAQKRTLQSTDPFLKNKYAFQCCKLLFYNNRLQDCIRCYDENFGDNNGAAVAPLALSYKGGSLFRLGKRGEAAYAYSKAFAISDQNRRGIFLGFLWATNWCDKTLRNSYIALGKNNDEKATIAAMFGLHGIEYGLETAQQVYALSPRSPLLPLLATREINKLEEQYLTPLLSKESGGKEYYYLWENKDATLDKDKLQLANTLSFLQKVYTDNAVPNRGLYAAGAAYLSFIKKDYATAKEFIAKAKAEVLPKKVKDQVELVSLLVMANEQPQLSAQGEEALLPSVKWLISKAKEDEAFRVFCRNFFSQVLAQKYTQQAEPQKVALAYGMADLSFIKKGGEAEYNYAYSNGTAFIRSEMSTADLLSLYGLFTKTNPTPFEKLLLTNASFTRNDVIDVIGTSYLRSFDFQNAVTWLKRSSKPEPLIEYTYNYVTNKEKNVAVDPFYDYLNDWQRYDKVAPQPYTKLSLAQKFAELQKNIDTAKAPALKAKLYYQLASGLYNMSQYGNSWSAVAYDRSGNDWNEGNYKQGWQKEYFGVYRAKEYYQKAYDATPDKEFKAACLFMIAKCAQRQILRPTYGDKKYKDGNAYDKDLLLFEKKFKNYPLFESFTKEFGTTKFYKYAFTRCSYLRDFVAAKSALRK